MDVYTYTEMQRQRRAYNSDLVVRQALKQIATLQSFLDQHKAPGRVYSAGRGHGKTFIAANLKDAYNRQSVIMRNLDAYRKERYPLLYKPEC